METGRQSVVREAIEPLRREPSTGGGRTLRVIAHDRFTHHGGRSGYVQVLPHLASSAQISVIHLPLALRGVRAPFEWWRAAGAVRGADAELHIYPEQTLFPRMAKTPVVAVCHQPAEYYLHRRPRRTVIRLGLARATALVALGPEQARGLKAVNPNVVLAPHGVDTDWFSPGEATVQEGRYLAVRGWLRDAREQTELVRLALERSGSVDEIGRDAPRLSDEEYRDALVRCSAVLLCIGTGVASNAVLEAASCAKPVLGKLSLDLQSYLSDANRELLLYAPEVQLASSVAELAHVGAENRKHVLTHYAWPHVASQLASLIDTVGERRNRETS